MSYRAYVGNAPFRYLENEGSPIKDFLEGAVGTKILNISVPLNNDTGRPKGFAFVELEDEAGLKKLVELSGTDLAGRALNISVARPRPDYGGR